MSLFDYPRINVKGTIQLNPGTANNDDYAGAVSFPAEWGPFAGETLALIDSKKVEAQELLHVHEPALSHQCAVDQPAHPAQ